MGYYSDVAVHMPKDTYMEMLKVFDKGENVPRSAQFVYIDGKLTLVNVTIVYVQES